MSAVIDGVDDVDATVGDVGVRPGGLAARRSERHAAERAVDGDRVLWKPYLRECTVHGAAALPDLTCRLVELVEERVCLFAFQQAGPSIDLRWIDLLGLEVGRGIDLERQVVADLTGLGPGHDDRVTTDGDADCHTDSNQRC